MKNEQPRFSADRRAQTRFALLNEISTAPKKTPRYRSPLVLSIAGAVILVGTGSTYYIATQAVEDTSVLHCYYHADLKASQFVKSADEEDPGYTVGPYVETGRETLPGQSDQIEDAIAFCADLWDLGMMNPEGVTDDLIPENFEGPVKKEPTGTIYRDENGIPYTPPEESGIGPGHYVPELTACVVDDTVAVIPGDENVCARLGIPSLEK